MNTTQGKLTPAAKRDLSALQAGQAVDLRFGPFEQLVNAGLIEGPQDAPRLTVLGLATRCVCGSYNHDGTVRCCPMHTCECTR